MLCNRVFLWGCVTGILVACLAGSSLAAPDIAGKVVLANMDKHPVTIRVGEARKEIAPQKATVLTPKAYPVSFEFYTGVKARGWQKQVVTEAGVYAFDWHQGGFAMRRLEAKKKPATTTPPTVTKAPVTSRPAPRTAVVRPYVRRPVIGTPVFAGWSPLARLMYLAGDLYRFCRDEQDRDLLHRLIWEARNDEDAFRRWLEKADLDKEIKDELGRITGELDKFTDDEWKEIEEAEEVDWKKAEEEIGDEADQVEMDSVDVDLKDIGTEEFSSEAEDVSVEDLSSDGAFDFDEDIDVGDLQDASDLGVDSESFDLPDFSDDSGDAFGGHLGDDVDGGFEDFGGFDDGGGGFDDFDF